MTNYKTFTEMEYRHLESERDSLRKQLAKFQESEFHPDFSMLEATRESLREHMAMYKALANENEWLRAELAAARATIAESKAFIEKSFEVHPNLDLDVAAIDAAMKEGEVMDDLYQEFAMSKFATKEDRDKAILQALADEREKASKSVKHITAQNLLLRTQLAAAQATIRRLENSTTEAWANHMREQLAAAQAEIAEMMQALEQFALIDLGQKTLPYSFALNVLTARKLISRPTNLEALHEALARECERLAESEGVEEGHSEWLIEEAAKHRARKRIEQVFRRVYQI